MVHNRMFLGEEGRVGGQSRTDRILRCASLTSRDELCVPVAVSEDPFVHSSEDSKRVSARHSYTCTYTKGNLQTPASVLANSRTHHNENKKPPSTYQKMQYSEKKHGNGDRVIGPILTTCDVEGGEA